MRHIPLTQGKTALVDDEDYERISQYRWYAARRRGIYYAASDAPQKSTLMHRFIIGAERGEQVDHHNGDGLDNTRKNLRKCSDSQQRANSKVRVDSPLGLKGVGPCWHKFRARIRVNGREKHLGVFDTAEEAARAYDQAALEIYGEFARTNYEY